MLREKGEKLFGKLSRFVIYGEKVDLGGKTKKAETLF